MAHQRGRKVAAMRQNLNTASHPDSQVILKMVDTGAPITRPALNSELRHCGVHLPVRKSFHTDESPSIIRARGGERAKVVLAVRDGMSPLYWRAKRRMRHRSRTRLLQFWNLVNKHLTAALTGYLVQPSSRPRLSFLFLFFFPPTDRRLTVWAPAAI